MQFQATDVFADYDEFQTLIIGFYAESDCPDYFMIQHSDHYTDADKKLGMNTFYIEKNDQSMGCYGGITQIVLDRSKIRIDLNEKSAERLGELNIEISFNCADDQFLKLESKILHVFSNYPEIPVIIELA